MSITLKEEPADFCRQWGFPITYETCCFCKRETTLWCVEKDVACCSACAEIHTLEDVPDKETWCESVKEDKDNKKTREQELKEAEDHIRKAEAIYNKHGHYKAHLCKPLREPYPKPLPVKNVYHKDDYTAGHLSATILRILKRDRGRWVSLEELQEDCAYVYGSIRKKSIQGAVSSLLACRKVSTRNGLYASR